MLGGSELIAFLATTDLARARAFYEDTWNDKVAWFRDPDGNTLSLTEMP